MGNNGATGQLLHGRNDSHGRLALHLEQGGDHDRRLAAELKRE